jgi:hypothetical protein
MLFLLIETAVWKSCLVEGPLAPTWSGENVALAGFPSLVALSLNFQSDWPPMFLFEAVFTNQS